MGRPPIGKTAMTSAERVRRHRQRHDTTRKLERAARQFMATGEELMRLLRESIFRLFGLRSWSCEATLHWLAQFFQGGSAAGRAVSL
jgi:hypothetical protein